MSYCVVDTEITIRNRGEGAIGDSKSSPHHPANEIVALGAVGADDADPLVWGSSTSLQEYGVRHVLLHSGLLVFQNASFDVQWLMRADKAKFLAWIRGGGRIFDTQIAEYILTGQEHTFAALNELSAKYGGTQKDTRIEDYINAGVDTCDIPKDELLEYLRQDVLNTEIVFLAQVAEAERLGMLPLLRVAMDDRLATILMEWNGMRYDIATAERLTPPLRAKLAELHAQICLYVNNSGMFCKHTKFNPSSHEHVSVALFGGELKYIADVPVYEDPAALLSGRAQEPVRYKTGARAGQVKTKQGKLTEKCKGFGVTIVPAWKLAKEGFFSTADENLVELLADPSVPTTAQDFIKLLLEYRSLAKDIATYYEGYAKLVWPTDGCIHPSINHTLVATGRLSCSKPNLQNCSREDT